MKILRLKYPVILLSAVFCLSLFGLHSIRAEGENLSSEDALDSAITETVSPESSEHVPGELIIKLKDGAALEDLAELNQKYGVDLSRAERVFPDTPSPQEVLDNLKEKYNTLTKKHEEWYWYTDKTQESKDYEQRIKEEKVQLEKRIKVQEELIAHLEARQKKASGPPMDDSFIKSTFVLYTNEKTDIPKMAADYAAHPSIEYAEPDYILHPVVLSSDTYVDANQDDQWETGTLDQSGQVADMWGLQKIEAEKAWDALAAYYNDGRKGYEIAGEGVIVAVIGTGVDYTHPDLKDNIWVNQGEIPDNGIDDDKNGYIDDVRGWDFGLGKNNPMDNHGHETLVAGIIAAVPNDIGIIGVAPRAKIMVLRTALKGSWVNLSYGAVLKALKYAADNRADVINCSFGDHITGNTEKQTIGYAISRGCLIVASAGNEDSNIPHYPSSYPETISVGATTFRDKKCSYSNWGELVDVSAPSGDHGIYPILSTNSSYAGKTKKDIWSGNAWYGAYSGTSFSAPFVSGIAALLISRYPDEKLETIRARIEIGVDPLLDLQHPDVVCLDVAGVVGTGRVNAYKALTVVEKPYFKIINVLLKELKGDKDGIPESGEEMKLSLTLKNYWNPVSSARVELSSDNPAITINEPFFSEIGSIGQRESKKISFTFKVNTIHYDTPVECILSINADGQIQELHFRVDLGVRRVAAVIPSYESQIISYSVSGNKVVWEDARYHDNKTDIFLFDLDKNKETLLIPNSTAPSICGSRVSCVNEKGDIILYDLKNPQSRKVIGKISKYRRPFITDDYVAWENEESGGIDIYSIKEDKIIERLTPESGELLQDPIISGRRISWKVVDRESFMKAGPIALRYRDDIEKPGYKEIEKSDEIEDDVAIWSNKIAWKNFVHSFIGIYDIAAPADAAYKKIDIEIADGFGLAFSAAGIAVRDSFGGENGAIFLYNPETGSRMRITSQPTDKILPVLSGYLIFWIDYRDGYDAIYMSEIIPELSKVAITSPQDGATVFGKLTLTGTAAAPSGIKEVRVAVSDSYPLDEKKTPDTCGLAEYNPQTKEWRYKVESPMITAGKKYHLYACAKSDDGVWSGWVSVAVQVAEPQVIIISPIVDVPVKDAFVFTGRVENIANIEGMSVLTSAVCGEQGISQTYTGKDSWSMNIPKEFVSAAIENGGKITLKATVLNVNKDRFSSSLEVQVVDAVPPVVTISSPMEGATMNSNSDILFRGSAQDNIEVNEVLVSIFDFAAKEYLVDKANAELTQGKDSCTWKYNLKKDTLPPNSSFVVEVTAKDKAGNESYKDAVLINTEGDKESLELKITKIDSSDKGFTVKGTVKDITASSKAEKCIINMSYRLYKLVPMINAWNGEMFEGWYLENEGPVKYLPDGWNLYVFDYHCPETADWSIFIESNQLVGGGKYLLSITARDVAMHERTVSKVIFYSSSSQKGEK